ncbi:MAG: hypothetical protein ABIH71_02460 [Candidatus Omnitrophota bacterium]
MVKILIMNCIKINTHCRWCQRVRYLKERNDYLYLWERQTAFPANKKEKIPYKVLCADSGKVIFLYPQKLSVDSKKNISVQQYLRESVLSLKEKFSWTKLDGVIE